MPDPKTLAGSRRTIPRHRLKKGVMSPLAEVSHGLMVSHCKLQVQTDWDLLSAHDRKKMMMTK